MSLTSLPTELQDHIFSYLAWKPSEDIFPYPDAKQDIANASLTCKQLRRVLVPVVFKDVVLRLRWAGGVLVEPSLLRLRLLRQDLTRHIRSVYIRTGLLPLTREGGFQGWTQFELPESLEDWLDPVSHNSYNPSHTQLAKYRARVDEYVQELYRVSKRPTDPDVPPKASAETIVRLAMSLPEQHEVRSPEDVAMRSLSKPVLEALSLVLLCVPQSTSMILFKSLPDHDQTDLKPHFSITVAGLAIDLLADRLSAITIVANDVARSLGMSRRQQQQQQQSTTGMYNTSYLSYAAISKLNIRQLSLGNGDNLASTQGNHVWRQQRLNRWHGTAHSVRHLRLDYVGVEVNQLIEFVRGFQLLDDLRLYHVALSWQRPFMQLGPIPVVPLQNIPLMIWLTFVVEIRRSRPNLHFVLSDLHELQQAGNHPRTEGLPKSSITWLMTAAPAGALIDTERFDRLAEDFESFLPLWAAEESDRGTQATADWSHMRATLCDDAMKGRWQLGERRQKRPS